MNKIDGIFFFNVLRHYLGSFNEVKFSGTDFVSKNCPGGSTGNDPSY